MFPTFLQNNSVLGISFLTLNWVKPENEDLIGLPVGYWNNSILLLILFATMGVFIYLFT